ncbi:MAG TPA: hypothetical protein VF280_10545 [Burkholderiales bacterium]|jgi:hypothetical protein
MANVALFLGQATATRTSSAAHTGNRHAVIVFLRQEEPGLPDFAQAEAELATRGWNKIEFTKAFHEFPVENLNAVHPSAGASYEDALTTGFAAIVFGDPIENAL